MKTRSPLVCGAGCTAQWHCRICHRAACTHHCTLKKGAYANCSKCHQRLVERLAPVPADPASQAPVPLLGSCSPEGVGPIEGLAMGWQANYPPQSLRRPWVLLCPVPLGAIPIVAPGVLQPMKYRLKSCPTVEAITFDELAEHGRKQGVPCYGPQNLPWSFTYAGRAVTHENDDCYLVSPEVGTAVRFPRGAVLITGDQGQVGVFPSEEIFATHYEPVAR